jgi:hypothetical protein
VYNTICDILQKEEVDDNDEVTYHAASIQLMQAYLWKGISAQHVLYMLGGLSIVPARFCANSEICIGTNAHNKVKGLLPLASLNKCLHDLAKEHKVAPMVQRTVLPWSLLASHAYVPPLGKGMYPAPIAGCSLQHP